MRLSSFRLTLLDFVARVLRRWLGAVTARIDSSLDARAEGQPKPPRSASADDAWNTPPSPPDHWVELVRQHAPQLLDPDASDGSGVIDYRADDAFYETPSALLPRLLKPRPLSVITPQHRPPAPVQTVKSAPRRPLRLGNVRVQPLEADSVADHPAQTDAGSLELPTTQAAPRQAAQPPIRRPQTVEADALPEHQVPALPDQPPLSPHFSSLPVERRIRDVHVSLPDQPQLPSLRAGHSNPPDVPSVRTRAGDDPGISQRRKRQALIAALPPAPEQSVLRPTITPVTHVPNQPAPERWASLPDSTADEPPNTTAENRHRARLKREQEGRTWSE